MRRRCLSVFILCTLAIFVAGSSAVLAAPNAKVTGTGPKVDLQEGKYINFAPSGSRTPAAVLFDQTAGIQSATTSQNFEAAYDDYDTEGADDFQATGGAGWSITNVFVNGVANNTTDGFATSLRVTIYVDNAGVPGAVLCDYPAIVSPVLNVGPFVNNRSYDIALTSPCVVAVNQRAWVSVVANLDLGTGGQWFWAVSNTSHANAIYIAKWRNPGGLFPGIPPGCTDWNDLNACSGTRTQFAFRISGNLLGCTLDTDCNDNNPCTTDTCTAGVCGNANNTDACNDNNGCTQTDTCSNGVCIGSNPVVCNDNLFCTIDTCNTANGQCVFSAGTCDDGGLCTIDFCDETNDICVNFSPPARTEFCNTGLITIPAADGTDNAPGSPYPSPIAVAGLPVPAVLCDVVLNDLNHTWSGDMDLLLAKAGGSNAIIWSDISGSIDFAHNNFVLRDNAPTNAGPIAGAFVNGTYKPTNVSTGDVFPAPAPAPVGGSALSTFGSGDQNGTWNMWAVDDTALDIGNMAGGYCLRFMRFGCDVDADCDDLNACNGVETCVAGQCAPGQPTNCNDNNTCTIDSCNPANGQCQNVPNTCNDGQNCTSDVCVPGQGCTNTDICQTFCAGEAIALSADVAAPGSPYPSMLTISSLSYPTLLEAVELRGISHTFPDDIDVMLVSPVDPGINSILMGDVGGGTDAINVSLVLSDTAATALPDATALTSGTFRPANYTPADVFDPPAPGWSGATTVGNMNVSPNNPNGDWSLYVVDQFDGDGGVINDWCLKFRFVGCTTNDECDDSNTCTSDVCNAGSCSNTVNVAAACGDDFCLIESCSAQDGCSFVLNECNDGIACTTDSCNFGTQACVNTPGPAPAAVGNTITFDNPTTMNWTGEPAPPFNVYRGDIGSFYSHTCDQSNVGATTAPIGAFGYYLVSREDACGESGLGSGTPGPRPNTSPCP